MRDSILLTAFFPPLSAFSSASSQRAWASFTCASTTFLSLSNWTAASCSILSSSARQAASTMARWAFSSDILDSLDISSRSAFIWLSSDSSFLVGVGEILLGSAPVPVGALQERSCLLQGVSCSARFPLSNDQGVLGNRLLAGLLLKVGLGISDLRRVFLDGALSLKGSSISVLQSDVQIANISLELLLHP